MTVASAATDDEVNLEMDISQLKGIYIVSDKAVTIETNSGSSPTDTIVLVADVPYIWHTDSYHAKLFTADITANIFITNASGATATVDIEMIHDSTLVS